MQLSKLTSLFHEKFGPMGEIRSYFSPGRVNLIGEHTDYNGGRVFPCALSLGTYACARKRPDRKLRFASGNFPTIHELSLDNLHFEKDHDWANYPKGVFHFLEQAGKKLGGMDLYFYGDLPNGAGLSSSASIELVAGVIADDLFELKMPRVDLVKIGQKAENDFVGVNCGIMDQFAIGMGKKDHAIFLDCANLDFELVPIKLGKVRILIANTNKRRGLADSKYNERRKECEDAVKALSQKIKISFLGEIDSATLLSHKSLLPSETVFRRARHAVSENERTQQAVAVLKKGDLAAFGKLMNASHISLRDDYEVTGKELDSLAAAAWDAPGVLGSRMTGAGFGGCTVSLVNEEAIPDFIQKVGERYQKETGLKADFYTASPGEGAGRITEGKV